MKKSIFSLLFALVGVGTLTTSCEDMLTPDLDRYTTNFSGKDTVNFYLGIMSNLQDMIGRTPWRFGSPHRVCLRLYQ